MGNAIAIMNLILHGIEAPQHPAPPTPSSKPLANIQEKQARHHPGRSPPQRPRRRNPTNFPIETGETAFLFLQHLIEMLKAGGRAIVIENAFLSNTDNIASARPPQDAARSCNLHASSIAPARQLQVPASKPSSSSSARPAGVETHRTQSANMSKTNQLNDDDLAEFIRTTRNSSRSTRPGQRPGNTIHTTPKP